MAMGPSINYITLKGGRIMDGPTGVALDRLKILK